MTMTESEWTESECFDTRTELDACYPCPDVDCDKENNMGHFIKLLCRFLGHKKGQTWEHQGDNSVCKRCGVVYKSGASYYRLRSFSDASRSCGMSESIYRVVDIYTKYAKNHTTPLQKRVPLLDRLSKDWVIYDSKEAYQLLQPDTSCRLSKCWADCQPHKSGDLHGQATKLPGEIK